MTVLTERSEINVATFTELEGVAISTFRPTPWTNEEIEVSKKITTSSGRPLTARGIEAVIGSTVRYIARPEETGYSMAEESALRALDGTTKADVIIGVHSFGEMVDGKPVNYAQRLNKRLGLKATYATDVIAACSGFGVALDHARKYPGKRVLIACGEKYSPYLKRTDRIIFSDLGGAMVIDEMEKSFVVEDIEVADLPVEYQNAIYMPVDSKLLVHPFIHMSCVAPPQDDFFFSQNGELVRTGVRTLIPQRIYHMDTLPKNGYSQTVVIPHQPTKKTLDELILELPGFKVVEDYKEANGSSVAILKALEKAINHNIVRPNEPFILVPFGARMMYVIARCRIPSLKN